MFAQPHSIEKQVGPGPTFAQDYAQSVMSGGGGYPRQASSNPPGTIAEPMSSPTPPPVRDSGTIGSPVKNEIGTQGLADPNSFVSRNR
ncbi:uncharacterized protein JCM15063_005097 [Sporobolomyces koalae]|uniref:uncharacterized protein n=1 Tax=Sporobolomyces koalae TaxID=500713 RepID=UPI00317BFE70